MNKSVDNYFIEGCSRCPLGGTPDCKVHSWTSELELLRKIVLNCGLTEESKWGVPCYTYQSKNILMVSALKEYCCISFFKGYTVETFDWLSVPILLQYNFFKTNNKIIINKKLAEFENMTRTSRN